MSRSSSSIRVLVTGSGTVGAYILRAMTSAAYRSRLDVALMVRDPSLKVDCTAHQPTTRSLCLVPVRASCVAVAAV